MSSSSYPFHVTQRRENSFQTRIELENDFYTATIYIVHGMDGMDAEPIASVTAKPKHGTKVFELRYMGDRAYIQDPMLECIDPERAEQVLGQFHDTIPSALALQDAVRDILTKEMVCEE